MQHSVSSHRFALYSFLMYFYECKIAPHVSGDVGGCIQDVLHATACHVTVGDLLVLRYIPVTFRLGSYSAQFSGLTEHHIFISIFRVITFPSRQNASAWMMAGTGLLMFCHWPVSVF
jgi:hypothetical protein